MNIDGNAFIVGGGKMRSRITTFRDANNEEGAA